MSDPLAQPPSADVSKTVRALELSNMCAIELGSCYSRIPSPLVNLSRKQVYCLHDCTVCCCSHLLAQLQSIADNIGVRIQKLGREEALRKIYQMKGISPPKQPLLTSPSSPPRKSRGGVYRASLYDDAMDMVHKGAGANR